MEDRTVRLREQVYGSVMEHMRLNHADMIDSAYEFFWEEEYPEDFLAGLALELAFVNFEDWLVCDYVIPDGRSVIDLYIAETGNDETPELRALRESVLSLYEVKSIMGEKVEIEDYLLGESFAMEGLPMEGLRPGDLFAARFVRLGGELVMGPSIYPFPQGMKEAVLNSVNALFIRYKKNKNLSGSVRQFLKDEAYCFNMIWMSSLYKKSGAVEGEFYE